MPKATTLLELHLFTQVMSHLSCGEHRLAIHRWQMQDTMRRNQAAKQMCFAVFSITPRTRFFTHFMPPLKSHLGSNLLVFLMPQLNAHLSSLSHVPWGKSFPSNGLSCLCVPVLAHCGAEAQPLRASGLAAHLPPQCSLNEQWTFLRNSSFGVHQRMLCKFLTWYPWHLPLAQLKGTFQKIHKCGRHGCSALRAVSQHVSREPFKGCQDREQRCSVVSCERHYSREPSGPLLSTLESACKDKTRNRL